MSNKQGKGSRSLAGTIVGIVLVIGAAVIFQLTGIDITEFLGEPEPTAVIEPTQPPTSPDSPDGTLPAELTTLTVGQGRGFAKDFWQVYFNEPTGSSDESTYVDGLDVPLAQAIGQVQSTLDIAAFEMNNTVIEEAILAAHERGVRVRVVTDDEHGIEDEKDFSIRNFIDAGIPVVDDDRSGLMHNKFMIMDGHTVWTGSWNYTINGTYRNNNNALVLRSPNAVSVFQAEFDEMFNGKSFGITSPESNVATYVQGDTPIGIFFAAENDVMEQVIQTISEAEEIVRFMTFSFTHDDLGQAMIAESLSGTEITGIFENRGAGTRFSELTRMFCAGMPVRVDGNPYTLHHKVIIVDDDTVITGSFNFSNNATESNDENLVIITNPDIAALYIDEFNRMWDQAEVPDDIDCQ